MKGLGEKDLLVIVEGFWVGVFVWVCVLGVVGVVVVFCGGVFCSFCVFGYGWIINVICLKIKLLFICELVGGWGFKLVLGVCVGFCWSVCGVVLFV